jgi:hypothetical protein
MEENIADMGRKAAKEKFKAYLEDKLGEDSKALRFMVEMFDASLSLIIASARNKGGMPGKGEIIKYFADKSLSFGELSSANRVACVKSAIGFVSDANSYKGAAKGVGIGAYVAVMIYDGLDTFENCDLAYLDYKGEQQVEELRRRLAADRPRKHAQGVWELKAGKSIDEQMSAILENQCRMPPSSAPTLGTGSPTTL